MTNCVDTLGADCRKLVAQTFPSSCWHHQEQIPTIQCQVDGSELERSEFGEIKYILQVLLHLFGPRKTYKTQINNKTRVNNETYYGIQEPKIQTWIFI